jgi:nitrate reductase gamma subunit
MNGFSVLQLINYVSFGVFACLFIGRTIGIARLPSGLRWELYPIPGRNGEGPEGKEDSNRFARLMQEVRYMAKEILLFCTYFKRKKSYWYFVYPLHISMYLYILWVFFMFAGAFALAKGFNITSESPEGTMAFLFYATYFAGGVSFLVMTLSTAGLTIFRLVDRNLRLCTTPVIYLNLLFALAISFTGFLNWLWFDKTFNAGREYFKNLITFAPASGLHPLMVINLLLTSLFIIYLPCSRMMHFVTKYFLYHKILWETGHLHDDSRQNRELSLLLHKKISWAAPHISTGRTWEEVASENRLPSHGGTDK